MTLGEQPGCHLSVIKIRHYSTPKRLFYFLPAVAGL